MHLVKEVLYTTRGTPVLDKNVPEPLAYPAQHPIHHEAVSGLPGEILSGTQPSSRQPQWYHVPGITIETVIIIMVMIMVMIMIMS